MKRLSSILILCLLISSYAEAQKRGKSKERINALRVGFITEKLELTTAESEKFWPVYNEYDDKRTELRREYRQKRKASAQTDDEAEKQIMSNFDNQEKLIALKRTYYNKFKTVLPAKKLARLEKAEREFKKVIVKEMQRRKQRRQGQGQKRQRNNNN